MVADTVVVAEGAWVVEVGTLVVVVVVVVGTVMDKDISATAQQPHRAMSPYQHSSCHLQSVTRTPG